MQSGFSRERARPLPPRRGGLTVSHSTADPATGGPRHPDMKHLLTGRQKTGYQNVSIKCLLFSLNF